MIEDLVAVVREGYPEFFAEIAAQAGLENSPDQAPFRAERGISSAGDEFERSFGTNEQRSRSLTSPHKYSRQEAVDGGFGSG